MNGAGDPECLGWTGRVSASARGRGIPLTHYNVGVRGATSGETLERFEREAEPRLHDDMDGRVVAAFGANDLAAEDPRGGIDTAARSLERLIGRVSRPLLFVGPPPVGDGELLALVTELGDQLEHVCAHAGVPFVGVLEQLAASGTWQREAAAGDGFHPGAAAYAEMAAAVDGSPVWREWLERPAS